MTDHQSLCDEGVDDRERRRHDAGGRAREQAEHAPAREKRNGQKHRLLEQGPRHGGFDDRHDSVLGHRAWQASAQTEGAGEEILPGCEDEVVAERESWQKSRADDRHGEDGDPAVGQCSTEPRSRHSALSWHA